MSPMRKSPAVDKRVLDLIIRRWGPLERVYVPKEYGALMPTYWYRGWYCGLEVYLYPWKDETKTDGFNYYTLMHIDQSTHWHPIGIRHNSTGLQVADISGEILLTDGSAGVNVYSRWENED